MMKAAAAAWAAVPKRLNGKNKLDVPKIAEQTRIENENKQPGQQQRQQLRHQRHSTKTKSTRKKEQIREFLWWKLVHFVGSVGALSAGWLSPRTRQLVVDRCHKNERSLLLFF